MALWSAASATAVAMIAATPMVRARTRPSLETVATVVSLDFHRTTTAVVMPEHGVSVARMRSVSPGRSVAEPGETRIPINAQPTSGVGSVADLSGSAHDTTPTKPATATANSADKELFILTLPPMSGVSPYINDN